MAYEDGTFSSMRQIGPKRVRFPFLAGESADKYARVIERDYLVGAASYTPTLADRTSFTNLVTRSSSFGSWTAVGTPTVSASAYAPSQFISLDLIGDAIGSSTNYFTLAATLATSGTHTLLFAIRSGTTPGKSEVVIYDSTAAADRLRISVDFTAGAPTVTASIGTHVGTVPLDDSVYIIVARTASVTGGNSHLAYAFPSVLGAAANVYLGAITLVSGSSVPPPILTSGSTVTVSSPPTDYGQNGSADALSDPFAYLVAESEPQIFGDGPYWRVTRTYARIPASQTAYGSRLLVRPVMNDIKSGSSYAVSFDGGATSHVWTSRKTASVSGAPDVPGTTQGNTYGALPASATITIIGASSTQTFAANASDATIQTALSQAISGTNTYASSTYYPIQRNTTGIIVSARGISTTLTGLSSDSALAVVEYLGDGLGAAVNNAPVLRIDAANQLAGSLRTISSTAHGGSAGNLVALWNGDKLWATGRVVSAATDSFTVELDVSPGKDDVVTHCAFAPAAAARYVNGAVSVTVKDVADFYLPGVSVGITTAADIALVTPKTDPVSWLGEIVAASTYSVIEGSQLERWNGWPIYSQRSISAQMSDALDTVSVSA